MNRVVYIAKALGIALATFIIFIIVYSLFFIVSLFMANKKETNLQERIINNQNIIALDLVKPYYHYHFYLFIFFKTN